MKDKIKNILESYGIYGLPGGIDNMIDEIEQALWVDVFDNDIELPIDREIIVKRDDGVVLAGSVVFSELFKKHLFKATDVNLIEFNRITHYMEIPLIS